MHLSPEGLADGRDMFAETSAARLRETAERLQLALDAGAIVGTWVWDVPIDRLCADERFARTFGLDTEHCRNGVPLETVVGSIHDDDRQRVTSAIAAVLASGGPYRCEYRVRRHDGLFRWVEANGRAELDADGGPLRFPGLLLDIQQRKEAEAERDRANALLHSFIEAVPGVVYAKDRDGRMLVGNRGTTELIGKPPALYLDRTDAEFLADEMQAAAVMANDRRIMETGAVEQIEEDIELADGTPARWLSTKAPLRNAAGEVVGLIGSSVDITARVKAEAALKESQEELQRLNATLEQRVLKAVAEREAALAQLHEVQKLETIGQLTGGVAHDFNNLLTPVIGTLDLLNRKHLDERSQRLIGGALQAADRAKILVQRLLAFARKQRLEPRHIDVSTLVLAMVDLVERTIGPRVRVRVLTTAEGCIALVDPNQLELALLNLCVNARDAMPEGGDLMIAVDRIAKAASDAPDALAPGDYVVASVTDTGSGMDAATLARAIEPFYTTKNIGAGTGLGLSMVDGLAAQSGGALRLNSAPGKGTSAEIWLPIATADADAPAMLDIEDKRAPFAANVLVVDDEETVRVSVAESLRELGYRVEEAAEPLQAIALVQAGYRPDLVITDHMMPDMTGAELVAAMRRILPGLPALLVTGYAELTLQQETELDIIAKPFRVAELGRMVSEILRRG